MGPHKLLQGSTQPRFPTLTFRACCPCVWMFLELPFRVGLFQGSGPKAEGSGSTAHLLRALWAVLVPTLPIAPSQVGIMPPPLHFRGQGPAVLKASFCPVLFIVLCGPQEVSGSFLWLQSGRFCGEGPPSPGDSQT